MNIYHRVVYWTLYGGVIFLPIAHAQELVNLLHAQTIGALVVDIANLVTQIAIPIVVMFLIYAGFLFVSARGNTKQLEDAKKTFYWTIIGAAVVVGARALAEATVHFAQSLGGP